MIGAERKDIVLINKLSEKSNADEKGKDMEDTRDIKDELEIDDEVDAENEEMNEETGNSSETKNEKFIRIAEGRVTKILTWIRKLDNLSNRGNYEYTDEQVEQMFSAIEEEMAEIKSHFIKSDKEEKRFKFR